MLKRNKDDCVCESISAFLQQIVKHNSCSIKWLPQISFIQHTIKECSVLASSARRAELVRREFHEELKVTLKLLNYDVICRQRCCYLKTMFM